MSGWYILFLLAGRLLIYLANKFVVGNEIKNKFIVKLTSCVLCSGFWTYTILSLLTGYVILSDWTQVFVLSNIITGAVSAYLVYIFESGYKSLYGVIEIGRAE